MSLLARVRSRFDRRRGVLAAPEPLEGESLLAQPLIETAGTHRLERPEPTPSMHARDVGGTAGTRSYQTPHGTPSTGRLHNPQRPGR